jgi:hypothetical protein
MASHSETLRAAELQQLHGFRSRSRHMGMWATVSIILPDLNSAMHREWNSMLQSVEVTLQSSRSQ